MLRILSLWQPWATLCVAPDPAHGGRRPAKGNETRGWQPKSPPPIAVAIHATATMNGEILGRIHHDGFATVLQRLGYYAGDPRPWTKRNIAPPRGLRPLPLGAVVGVALIAGVEPTVDVARELQREIEAGGELGARAADELRFGNYERGRFAFRLEHAHELRMPIPFAGKQHALYEAPAHLEDDIAAQFGGRIPGLDALLDARRVREATRR